MSALKAVTPLLKAIISAIIEALLGKTIEEDRKIQDADKIDGDNPFAGRSPSEF